MSKYIFLFTIGPVQSFIAQARKAQDLFGGSQILSSLIGEVLDALDNEKIKFIKYPVDIIFPNQDKEETLKVKAYPNRFTMVANTNNVRQVGDSLKKYVQDKFKKYSENLLDKYVKNNDIAIIEKNFLNQINDFLEIYWVAIPIDEDSYYTAYKEMESCMGSVKNVRMFKQFPERGRKCSLCGCRNALFTNAKSNRKDGYINSRGFNKQNTVILKNNRFKKQEGLCAVCFTKRFFSFDNDDNYFDSLANIAILDSLAKIGEESVGIKKLDNYKNCFVRNNFDEELLFKENITKEYFDKCSIETIKDINHVKDVYAELQSYCKERKIQFNKYFATIAFDGDSMGKWLSGEKIKDPEEKLYKFHKELSKRLIEFAHEAKKYIDNESGRTIYAGGEDFLGLINLDKLFDAMKYLRTIFNEKVNKPLKSYYKNSELNITFSAGVVITHYKVPFSETLKWTRTMEKKAKDNFDDKDSFGLAILRRSGEISQAVLKWTKESIWNNNHKEEWVTEDLKNIVESIKNDKFSYTFLTNLMKEFRMFDKCEKIDNEMIKCEIGRLIKRSCKLQKKEGQSDDAFIEMKDKEINEIINNVVSLYGNGGSQGEFKMKNFLSVLSIIDFISREGAYEN